MNVSEPGETHWLLPSFQLEASITRYQFLPLPGQGNLKFTAPLQPL